jgi:hypothetical protein
MEWLDELRTRGRERDGHEVVDLAVGTWPSLRGRALEVVAVLDDIMGSNVTARRREPWNKGKIGRPEGCAPQILSGKHRRPWLALPKLNAVTR